MTLRNAALFAIVGTALWMLPLTLNLIHSLSGLAGGFASADAALTAIVHFVFALSLLVFFVVFYRSEV
jgi:hypothetical protein